MKEGARTISVGGFKLRSEVPSYDPVYRGVKEELKKHSNVTKSVTSVTILNQFVTTKEGTEVSGRQKGYAGGTSEIEIYARSFGESTPKSRRRAARGTVVHELDHADYQKQVGGGLFLDGEPDEKKIEKRARQAVLDAGLW